MTIQWTLVAFFLYLELAFIFLLMLPFISPKVWQYIFYSRIFRMVASKANIYFTVFIIVLLFFFVDSIREMLNYSSQTAVDLSKDIQIHVKLFRSQRNYYISGFTVFLWLVIRRLVILILCEADLISENESTMKRAQNATETLEKILKKTEEIEKEKSSITQTSVVKANELREAIQETQKELDNTEKELEVIRQKSQSVTKVYEELLEKHAELLNQVTGSEKKDTKEQDVNTVSEI